MYDTRKKSARCLTLQTHTAVPDAGAVAGAGTPGGEAGARPELRAFPPRLKAPKGDTAGRRSLLFPLPLLPCSASFPCPRPKLPKESPRPPPRPSDTDALSSVNQSPSTRLGP